MPTDEPQLTGPPTAGDDAGADQIFVDRLPPVQQKSYHPDDTRHRLVFCLLGLVAGVIVIGWLSVAENWLEPDQAKDLMTVTLGPLFTLLGTAVAFYFRDSGGTGST